MTPLAFPAWLDQRLESVLTRPGLHLLDTGRTRTMAGVVYVEVTSTDGELSGRVGAISGQVLCYLTDCTTIAEGEQVVTHSVSFDMSGSLLDHRIGRSEVAVVHIKRPAD